MESVINILLPYGYEAPTEDDIKAAKKWTRLRNDNAARLSSLIGSLLKKAAEELTMIGYKYNCKPEDFKFSQDEKLREEVAQVMDELEDEIIALVEEYSLNETNDKKRRNNLLPWLLALHGRHAKNLAGTLHERLRQFMYDTEAQIAAMKLAKYNQTKAIGRILSTMHAVYASPEMQAAFKKRSAAMYVQTHGVHYDNRGLSSSGAVNVENFGNMTAKIAWSRSQYEKAKEEGKDGYLCFRGSTYPCASCDDVCGVFHPIEEGMVLPVHGHCCCYAVFIRQGEQDNSTNNDTRSEFNSYPTEIWEHSYYSEDGEGYVVTEKKRLAEADASGNERDKFDKESRMCRVAADNGFRVELLHGSDREKGQTYDTNMNGIPTELKSTNSVGNLVKHIRTAYKEQGAKSVLLELEDHNPAFYDKMNEAKRKYNVTLFFYFKDDRRIRMI